MELTAQMDVTHGTGDGRHETRGVFWSQRLCEMISQCPAGDVFQHEQEPIIGLRDFVQRNDVGMPHARCRLGLAEPLAAPARAGPPSAGQEFSARRGAAASPGSPGTPRPSPRGPAAARS